MHYYKRNIGDYHKKAGRLSILQHGAYTLLIDACYDRERFPTLEEAIDWAWAFSDEEKQAVEFVLRKFFTLEDGFYVQARIMEEIDAYHENNKTNKRIAIEREEKRRALLNASSTNREHDVNEPSPNHKPLTINQEPVTSNQLNPDSKESVVSAKAFTPCPHLEIIAAYNRILPELQAVIPERWAGARADALKSRWRESPKHQRIEFWERFFTELRRWPFYMGENDRQWKADLGWIVKRTNFDKLIEKFTSKRAG